MRFALGCLGGSITNALHDFDHPEAHRFFEWDIAQVNWVKEHIHLLGIKEQKIVTYFLKILNSFESDYSGLRKSIVHNDANDNNVLVTDSIEFPSVKSLIDFGDAIHTQIINDLAISCAYGIMHYDDTLEAALPIVVDIIKPFL